jgi:hypothetical protein
MHVYPIGSPNYPRNDHINCSLQLLLDMHIVPFLIILIWDYKNIKKSQLSTLLNVQTVLCDGMNDVLELIKMVSDCNFMLEYLIMNFDRF